MRPAPIAAAPTSRGRRLRRVLLLSDLAAVAVATAVAMLVWGVGERAVTMEQQLLAVIVCLPALLILLHGTGLYHLAERHIDHTLAEELGPAFMVTTTWSWLLLIASSLIAGTSLRLLWFAVFWAALLGAMLTGRALVRRLTSRQPWYRQKVMLIGDPAGVDRVLRRIRRHPGFGLDPVGAIERTPEGLRTTSFDPSEQPVDEISCKDWAGDVLAQVKGAQVQRVVMTGWAESLEERTELIRTLATSGVYVDIVSGEPEALCAGASVHHVEGLPIVTIPPTTMTRTGRGVKRAIDASVAGVGLILLAPLFAYFSLRIKHDSPGPVFFRQHRSGVDGRSFQMLKLRTMVAGAEQMRDELRRDRTADDVFKLPGDPRITSYGAKLRRRSIDEFPQLWNVLRGDMSLVGPRPLPLDEAPLAADHFAERARVRPGMTGPWQIHGRSDIPFEDMVKLDYTYVSTWSLREDLRLLIRTVPVVFGGRGAY